MTNAKKVMEDVGQRIVELRRARGWTQEHLAERLHVDARTLQRIESGKNITLPTIIHLADVLGAPLATLFEPPAARVDRRPGRPRKVATIDANEAKAEARVERARPAKTSKTRAAK